MTKVRGPDGRGVGAQGDGRVGPRAVEPGLRWWSGRDAGGEQNPVLGGQTARAVGAEAPNPAAEKQRKRPPGSSAAASTAPASENGASGSPDSAPARPCPLTRN